MKIENGFYTEKRADGEVCIEVRTLDTDVKFIPDFSQYEERIRRLENPELRGRQWIKCEHGYFAGSVSTGGSSGGGAKSEKGLDKSAESGIIETAEQKRLKQMKNNGEITTKINSNIQNRHYKGTNEYKSFLANGVEESYFTIPQSELQKILDKKFATGSVRIDKAGVAREIFDCGKIVAYDTKINCETSFVKAHY